MSLFCDYYGIAADALFINAILFNRWDSEVQVKKILHNSNLYDGRGAVIFFNLNAKGQPDSVAMGGVYTPHYLRWYEVCGLMGSYLLNYRKSKQ